MMKKVLSAIVLTYLSTTPSFAEPPLIGTWVLQSRTVKGKSVSTHGSSVFTIRENGDAEFTYGGSREYPIELKFENKPPRGFDLIGNTTAGGPYVVRCIYEHVGIKLKTYCSAEKDGPRPDSAADKDIKIDTYCPIADWSTGACDEDSVNSAKG